MDRWRKLGKLKKAAVAGGIGLLLIAFAMFSPELFVKHSWDARAGCVTTAEKRFQGEALEAKGAKISFYDKVILVNGNIERNEMKISDPAAVDCLSLETAVDMGKDAIRKLHEEGYYPTVLDSGFENWYSFSGSLYRYTEQYYGYSCFVWVLDFVRYDKAVTHQIYVDGQTGALIFAQMDGGADYPEDKTREINISDTQTLYQTGHGQKDRFTFLYTNNVEQDVHSRQSVAVSHKNLREMVNVPQLVQLTLPTPGGGEVLVNARVYVPDVDGMDVVRVSRRQYDEKDLALLCALSFPEGTQLNPPDLVQSVVDATDQDRRRWDGMYNKAQLIDFDNFNRCVAQISAAGADIYHFAELTDYDGNTYPGFVCMGRKDDFEGYLSVLDSEVVYSVDDDHWVPTGDTMVWKNSDGMSQSFVFYNSETDKKDTEMMMLYDILACRSFLDQMAFEDYEIEYLDRSGYIRRNENYNMNNVTYTKHYDGIRIVSAGGRGNRYAGNKISFGLHDHEIQRYNIGADIEFGQVLSERTELLSYEQMEALIGSELLNNLIIAGSNTNPGITLRLEYGLIDDMKGSVIVPVWDYYTAIQSVTEDGDPITDSELLLSVNAIDGSIVYDQSRALAALGTDTTGNDG